MQQRFLIKNGSGRLLLFFCGYGQDEKPFLPLCEGKADCDIALVYDYRDFLFDPEPYAGYAEISLLAWSMGVMAAPRVLLKTPLKIASSIAFNGTPAGIDANAGIPPELWDATLSNLNEQTALKFYRRMCSREDFAFYKEHLPARSVESLASELTALKVFARMIKEKDAGAAADGTAFIYDRAVAGTKDKIFGLKALTNGACACARAFEERDCEHFDREFFLEVFKNA